MIAVLGLLTGQSSYAGDCTLHVARTSCPGKESESYSKCKDSKAECDESKQTGSAEACAKEAVKACQNKRHDVTKDKKVTAKFKGQAVEGGKDFCATKVEGLFDPAQDFPFRGKADCK